MEQTIIALSGTLAIWISQQEFNRSWEKYACIVGIIGQPFWLYSTYMNIDQQWGMFICSVLVTFSWISGIKRFWFKRKERMIYKPGGVLHSIVWKR